jgi:seryl-tRNA synthetase
VFFLQPFILIQLQEKNSTDLFNANTILHETIHAYMSYILYKRQAVNNSITLYQYQLMTFDSVFKQYVDTLNASEALRLSLIAPESSAGADYDHNYMANNLLRMMSQALEKYVNNTAITNEYLWCLTWNGLQGTNILKKHWTNTGSLPVQSSYALTTNDSTRGLSYALTPTRCENILNIINDEYNATQNAKGKKRIPNGCY